MTEVDPPGFEQLTFNFGLLPGGEEASLPFSSRGEISRDVDDPLQGLTDAPRDTYPALRSSIAHAERLLREEIIELAEARPCSVLFKLFATCHLAGGRPTMANLFLRKVLRIHHRLSVAITGTTPALDVNQAILACMKDFYDLSLV
jgi:hypothetical protein